MNNGVLFSITPYENYSVAEFDIGILDHTLWKKIIKYLPFPDLSETLHYFICKISDNKSYITIKFFSTHSRCWLLYKIFQQYNIFLYSPPVFLYEDCCSLGDLKTHNSSRYSSEEDTIFYNFFAKFYASDAEMPEIADGICNFLKNEYFKYENNHIKDNWLDYYYKRMLDSDYESWINYDNKSISVHYSN